MKPINSRLAPTPSGFLHSGNILNFIVTWSLVRQSGGVLTLRIDDCDRRRIKDHYIDDLFETLEWLGLDWDTGPRDREDFEKHYSQIKKKELYWTYLNKVDHYFCSCSRRDIRERGKPEGYDQFCKQRGLDFKAEVTAARFCSDNDDFLLWTKDNNPAYQLVSVVDDLEGDINLIVRGDDLIETTAMQKELCRALGKDFPETLFHQLILGPQGEKLSKSNESESVRSLRENGMSKTQLFRSLAECLGVNASTLEEFTSQITPELLSRDM